MNAAWEHCNAYIYISVYSVSIAFIKTIAIQTIRS